MNISLFLAKNFKKVVENVIIKIVDMKRVNINELNKQEDVYVSVSFRFDFRF